MKISKNKSYLIAEIGVNHNGDINLAKEKFVTGMELAEGTNIFRFGVDKLDNLAEVLGVNLREDVTETQKLKFIDY